MSTKFDLAFHDAKTHARACYPQESCGIIVDCQYIAFENKAAPIEQHEENNPNCNCKLCSFKLDDKQYAYHLTQGEIQFIVHSHPDGQAAPSQADMEGQIQTDVAWAIIALDAENTFEPIKWGEKDYIPPLIGRSFIHGVTDCYSILRDCFRLGKEKLAEQGITDWPYEPIELDEFPRSDEWWRGTQDLYTDNFKTQGFVEIPFTDARIGDCFLMKIRCDKYNHAGILINDGLILHHLPLRLSRREPAGLWGRQAALWIRYQGKEIQGQQEVADA